MNDIITRTMTQETIDRDDGGVLAYYTRPGVEPPLLLIPGSFADRTTWDRMLEHFDPYRRVVIIEMRGHGNSWPPSEHSSIEGLAQDVLRVVDSMRLTKWYVAGHSIGGMAAIELARLRPASITGAIAIEGWTRHDVLHEAFGGDLANTLSEQQLDERASDRSEVVARWGETAMMEFAQIWRDWDGLETLERTRTPILELWGDRGRQHPTLEAMRIPDRENIEIRWIENASHSLLTERPDEVASAMNDFIARTKPK
ncbi:MAG: alpha/beta hydrolase [Candidatus Latescibacteria bacterium]|nr:alpha/beta hydrolase [Candidatus Latescibacterota bacterium]